MPYAYRPFRRIRCTGTVEPDMNKFETYVPIFGVFIFGAVCLYFAVMCIHLGRVYPVGGHILENHPEWVMRETNTRNFYEVVAMNIFLCISAWGTLLYFTVEKYRQRNKLRDQG